MRDDGGGGRGGEVPEGALSRPLTRQQSQVPFPSLSPPPPHPRTRRGGAPTGGPAAPPASGKGARAKDEAVQGALTSALPAAAGAGPGGARARPAHPPAAGLSWAPGSPALRPRVPKLLNLRAAHALRGQRPTRRIGPLGRLGPALAPREAPLWRSAPRSPPGAGALRRASARPQLPARRGASPPLSRGRESPPLESHPRAGPPCRDPQQKTDWSARPGSAQPPPASPRPRLGRCARSAGPAAAPVLWRRAQTLCPCVLPAPRPAPWDPTRPQHPPQLQASRGQNWVRDPLSKPQFPYQESRK